MKKCQLLRLQHKLPRLIFHTTHKQSKGLANAENGENREKIGEKSTEHRVPRRCLTDCARFGAKVFRINFRCMSRRIWMRFWFVTRRLATKAAAYLKPGVRWRGRSTFSAISAAHLSPIIGFRFRLPPPPSALQRTAKLQKGANATQRRAQAHFEVYERGPRSRSRSRVSGWANFLNRLSWKFCSFSASPQSRAVAKTGDKIIYPRKGEKRRKINVMMSAAGAGTGVQGAGVWRW